VLLLLCLGQVCAQSGFTGRVLTPEKEAVAYANIVLKDSLENRILAYAVTDEHGAFSFTEKAARANIIEVSALGWKMYVAALPDTLSNNQLDVVMATASVAIEEVIITAAQPVTVKGDTVIFDADYFSRGNERAVEDLLRNIPGLQVDADGTVRVNNREVEKIMVEEDDLLGDGYRLLSRNLPARTIDKVEVLENYHENPLFAKVRSSEKVALNLRLREEVKRVWFGQLDASGSPLEPFRHDATLNLMNLGSQTKYYAVASANNVGTDAGGETDHLLNGEAEEGFSPLVSDRPHEPISLKTFPTGLEAGKAIFNDEQVGAVSSLLHPKKGMTLRLTGQIDADRPEIFSSTLDSVSTENTSFVNRQEDRLSARELAAVAIVDLTYQRREGRRWRSVTNFTTQGKEDVSGLVFNGSGSEQKLDTRLTTLNHRSSYTRTFNENVIGGIRASVSHHQLPQRYQLPGLSNSPFAAGQQRTRTENGQMNLETFLTRKRHKDELLTWRIGADSRRIEFTSTFGEFSNVWRQNLLGAFTKVEKQVRFGNLYAMASLELRYVKQQFRDDGTAQQTKTRLFAIPGIRLDWRTKKLGRFIAAYQQRQSPVDGRYLGGQPIVTGFRSWRSGISLPQFLGGSTVLANHQLGSYGERFFLNTFVLLKEDRDFISQVLDISPAITKTVFQRFDDRRMLSATTNADVYLAPLRSNFKLKASLNRTQTKDSLSGIGQRELLLTNRTLGGQLRTGFSGPLNLAIGGDFSWSSVTTPVRARARQQTQYATLYWVPSDHWDFEVKADRYSPDLDGQGTKHYVFLNLEARYQLPETGTSFTLSAYNLFNTRQFLWQQTYDLGVITSTTRLLPRYLLLGASFSL